MRTLLHFRDFIYRRKKEVVLFILFSFLPLATSSLVVLESIQHQKYLSELSFLSWLLIFALLSIPISLSLIPNTLLGLMAGYFLGWAGLAGMTLSFGLACIWGYWFGLLVGKDFIHDVQETWPELGKHISRFRNQPVPLVSGLRLLPVPPFAIGSIVLAWLEIPFRIYFFASLAGMLPRMALIVFIGGIAKNLEDLIEGRSGLTGLIVSALLLAAIGSWLIFSKSGKRGIQE
jgi:uncharacterized membrane protein YdjX (TVP38/TMEM64 family)